MKLSNKLNLILSVFVLITATITQVLIFMDNPPEGYYAIYVYLKICRVLLLGFITLSVFWVIFKKKEIANIYVLFWYIGFLISIWMYMDILERFDVGADISRIKCFMLTPFITCMLLSLVIFIYNKFPNRK